MNINGLLNGLKEGDLKSLARCITLVENELEGSETILKSLSFNSTTPVIGITGPPGAGKSTLVNSLITELTNQNKRVAVIAIDPTSPFNYGSILGDRIRMTEHFNNPNVFIRSLATRGSLGGLSSKIIEITDVIKNAPFDYIIIETVGVGQSEVEIIGLADTTILVLVPEAGDEVQSIKSGIMEIADIFVVNKSDRPGADNYAKNLIQLLHTKPEKTWTPTVIKAVATQNEGTTELLNNVLLHQKTALNTKRPFLLAEKAYRLIQEKRMKTVDRKELLNKISVQLDNRNFNLYSFIEQILQ